MSEPVRDIFPSSPEPELTPTLRVAGTRQPKLSVLQRALWRPDRPALPFSEAEAQSIIHAQADTLNIHAVTATLLHCAGVTLEDISQARDQHLRLAAQARAGRSAAEKRRLSGDIPVYVDQYDLVADVVTMYDRRYIDDYAAGKDTSRRLEIYERSEDINHPALDLLTSVRARLGDKFFGPDRVLRLQLIDTFAEQGTNG